MAIVQQVKHTIEREESSFQSQQSYTNLRGFYEDMLRKGLVRKNEYDLPLVDTIGKTTYKMKEQDK